MAYTKKQRSDKGYDFFDDNGKKITIEQYTQATGANGSDLRKELARGGDKVSQQIIRNDGIAKVGKNLGDFAKTVGSSLQQGVGAAGDVALQGGALVGNLGALTNPFSNDKQKATQTANQLKNTENLRKLLQTTKDLEGKQIVGTSDVDANATRIAQGKGNARDVAAVLGKGLEVANTATMFANPASLARGATAKQVAVQAGKDAALFGGTGGAQSGLQTFGSTGDLGQALKSAGTGALIGGATAGALDVAAPIAGALTRSSVKNGAEAVNNARPSVIASKDPRVTGYDDQYSQLAQQFDNTLDPTARREVSKAMAQNRVERLNTQKIIQREIGQGGYIRLPNDGSKPKLTEEEYLSMNGAGFMEGSEPALQRNAIRTKTGQRDAVNKAIEEMSDNNLKRSQLRDEYNNEVNNGNIIRPSTIEKMIERANGLPELQATQAAQRLLTKQGINWKENADESLNTPNVDRRQETPQQDNTVSGEITNSKPETVKVFIKSKFRDGGGYADVPVIRREENVTLYQGTNAGDSRQFWTPNKKYAEKFGEVREKTGTFYQIDNGNRMTDVYVEAPSTPAVQRQISQESPVIDNNSNESNSVPPSGTATQQAELPTTQSKTRFAAQTAPNSGNLSPELANAVRENASSYQRSTNAGSVEESINFLSTRTEDEAIDDVLNRLGQKNIDRQAVTDAIATASSLDARGGTRNLELAQNIYDRLSEQLTKAGQTVQAASIISRRTPEGMAYNALREIQKADVPVTPEIRQAIITKTQEIGQLKLGSPERELATAELQKQVNKLIPTELVDKIVGTWKAGLLTGLRTTTGGALSNALFRGLREVSRPGAVATDMIASLITGKRSTALTSKGAWQGTAEGAKKAAKYLKTGVDERSFSADGKYIDREINFKNKALGTYVNGVFRVMGAADRPFYYSQFRNSLVEATIVEAKNLKLKGKAFDDYVNTGIKNPTDEATQYATDVAEQAVLANDTLLSEVANKLRAAVSKQENGAVRFAGKAAIGVLAPFTKVPSAFLSRVIDFTPVGAVKEVVTQMANKRLNQNKLVQAISEAATGTGLVYLGAELANNDLLTGNYPNDQTEQNRWKAEGITPNSIKIGNTYYSLNYAGPVGALFGIGKSINDAIKDGGDAATALTAGITQLASGTLEQSFLSGISGALDAVQDPKRYAENFVRSQAGSIIPTILNDIGNVTDETQRQTNTPIEAIQGRIPGARTGLNPKIDSLGNELSQANPNQVGRLVDPFRPSEAKSTPITDELDRLSKAGQPIFPSNDKTLKAGGETIKLDGDQQYTYNQAVGQETSLIWNGIISSPEYQALNDEQKKDMLSNASSDINTVAKKQYLEKIERTDAADKIAYTKRQQEYADGTIDPTLWLPSSSEAAIAKKESTKKAKTVAKAATKKASTKKTASKSSGSRKIGFKAPTSGGFKRTASTSAIRKLLSSAGQGIKAKSIG